MSDHCITVSWRLYVGDAVQFDGAWPWSWQCKEGETGGWTCDVTCVVEFLPLQHSTQHTHTHPHIHASIQRGSLTCSRACRSAMERRPTRKWLGVHCAHLAVTTNLQPNTASPSTEITLHLESGQSQQTENLFVFCEFDFIACDHTNNHTTAKVPASTPALTSSLFHRTARTATVQSLLTAPTPTPLFVCVLVGDQLAFDGFDKGTERQHTFCV